MTPDSRQYQRRFSLLEILTAVAIISIVLAMAILNYGNILPNEQAESPRFCGGLWQGAAPDAG